MFFLSYYVSWGKNIGTRKQVYQECGYKQWIKWYYLKNGTQTNILKEELKSEAKHKRNEMNCTICDKVFKTKSNL